MKRWHPDRWARNQAVAAEANWRFQQIQEAYSGIIVTATAKSNAVNAFSFSHFYISISILTAIAALFVLGSSLGPGQEVNVRRWALQPS